jgi:MscS family membrane protein
MEWIPPWSKETFIFIPTWKWIGIFVSIFLGLIIKGIVRKLVGLLRRVTAKSETPWDDQLILAVEKPAGYLAAAAFWFISLYVLKFTDPTLKFLTFLVQVVFSVSILVALYGLTDLLADIILTWTKKTETLIDDQIAPLLKRALRVTVVIFGSLVMIQNLGFNVMSVLAGLGLGGLAFALAAKDTCANLFGSIMILVDRPFRIGDWIVTGGVEGTVEEIGFRSTRVRTFYNSQVSIPNSAMAVANIDNMGRRKYRRIKTMLGVTYDTPPEKIEAFAEGIRNIIKANPYTRKDYYHVVFNDFGGYNLNLLLYCFLEVDDWAKELQEKQNIYMEIIRLAHNLKIEFAFPTQTLHVDSLPDKNTPKDHLKDPMALKNQISEFGPNGKESRPSGVGLWGSFDA